MRAKKLINRALGSTTGYELRKIGARPSRKAVREGDRLLEAPVFILSTVRSGSTLLRVVLDSHSRIFSPHEVHLADLDVVSKSKYSDLALRELGLAGDRLRYLLWDRILHRELAASGKDILVNKTPSDVFIVEQIVECWSDARFIFLLRHPAAIAASRHRARPQDSVERNARKVREYGEALERARRTYPGLTVRYEELASEPERVTRELCAFLGVEWEARMLEYGRFAHGRYRVGLGDWTENIKSGRVQPPAPPPAEIPPGLDDLCVAWGYLPAGARSPSPQVAEPAASPPR
ncbi:MAG: sulfotransferase [Thermoleophilaceae bacterium]|nr:sulfotransferase [Thermoleophilaceae bacterium]